MCEFIDEAPTHAIDGGDFPRISQDSPRRHFWTEHRKEKISLHRKGPDFSVARRSRFPAKIHSTYRSRDDVPETRPTLDLGLVREGDEFLAGHSQAEGVVHRERGAEGRRRAYSEPLGYGKRRLAQDLDFHGARADHFLDDAPGELGRPTSLVHEDITQRPRGVPSHRNRLASMASRQTGKAGTLHTWI